MGAQYTTIFTSKEYKHHRQDGRRLPQVRSHDSGPRQAPPNNPILLAILRLVSLSHEWYAWGDRSFRCHQEAVWTGTQVDACGQERRALQSGSYRGRFQELGSRYQVLRCWTTIGICWILV